MTGLFNLLIDSLAAWRLAFMLVHERGPGDIFGEIRRHLGVETVNEHGVTVCDDKDDVFGMFCCVYCMSIWTAALMRFARTGKIQPVKTLAVSAGALLVDRLIH